MRFLSVCSGIEAASVAWHPLGWRADAFAEIEKFPSAVLAHHYPDVPNLGDMTKYKDWPDATFDVLVGGTPCQSFSVAGLRKGLADPRGNLALVYLGILDRYRPRWMVWENVPGVLSSWSDDPDSPAQDDGHGYEIAKQRNDFDCFLGGLAELGYGCAYRVLDAQYIRVDGYARAVPQRRRRVFVVGHLGSWQRAAAVLFERSSLSGHPAPRREAGKGTAPTLSARTKGGGGLGTDFDCDGGSVAGTIGAALDRHATVQDAYAGNLIAFGGTGRLDFGSETLVCFDETQITSSENRCNPQPGDPSHPLAKGARPPTIAFSAKDHGADAMEDVSPTLRAGGHADSHANAGVMPAIAFDARQSDVIQYGECTGPLDTDGQTMGILQSGRVRRLMPVECERLQGFPDGYTDIPYRGRSWTPDGPRYKALGNSMAVNAMRWIGTRISMVDQIEEVAA